MKQNQRSNNKKSWDDIADANRRFYDEIAPVYEMVDTRRGQNKHQWIDPLLRKLKELCSTDSKELTFLDAGSGSGFLSVKASTHFENLVLVDISKAMIERIDLPKSKKIVADCSNIPLEKNINFS